MPAAKVVSSAFERNASRKVLIVFPFPSQVHEIIPSRRALDNGAYGAVSSRARVTNRILFTLSLALPSLCFAQQNAQETQEATIVLRTLDTNSDQQLSQDEVANATAQLNTLDVDGDGYLSEAEMGGGGPAPLRRQAIIRVLDEDGDTSLSPEEIEYAGVALKRLDLDGDWMLGPQDLNPPRRDPEAGEAPAAAGVTPANPAPVAELTGDILPGQDPRAFDGYTLIREASYASEIYLARRILLADESGEIVHEWPVEPYRQHEAAVAYLLENGLLLRTVSKRDWLDPGVFPVGANGSVQLVDWDGNVVWGFDVDVASKHILHHDVSPMPNGNILVIAYHAFSREEFASLGWDGVYPIRSTIWMGKVLELKPNLEDRSTEIVWQWNSWDHMVQDKFEDRPNYGDVSLERGKIDMNYLRDGMVSYNAGQLLHLNSVDYNAELDQIVLSSPAFAGLWIIDHSISTSETASERGDFLYRFGNPMTTKSGGPNDAVLYWQHDTHWIDDGLRGAGNILVYNNGNHRRMDGTYYMHQPGAGFGSAYSDLLELELPLQKDRTYDWAEQPTVVWSWNSDGREDYYSPFMSGLTRLPNGNTIFVSAFDKRIIEVTEDGERVEDYRLPRNGRMHRVYKYPKDHDGLEGRL